MEDALKHIKFPHLTQSELISYCDQGLDPFSLARAEAHLKLCLICDKRLTYLQEERAAFSNREITAEKVALVRRAIEKQSKPTESPTLTETPTLSDHLAEYLRQIVKSWQAHFKPLVSARRGNGTDGEIWRWKSKDGILKARAILENNADLTIHFSANDLDLERVRLKISIGPMTQKITLQRVSDSEIYAQMRVPERQRPKNLADISIEII